MEQNILKTLFGKIGQELGIQANLITCREFSCQQVYGWAIRIKEVNCIYINLDRIREDFNRLKGCSCIRFEGLPWIFASNINIMFFCVIVHEYTHLMDTPKSRIGLSEEDCFAILAPLGSRDDIIKASNWNPETEEERVKQKELDDQKHSDMFFNLLRLNVYRCGKILAELEPGSE